MLFKLRHSLLVYRMEQAMRQLNLNRLLIAVFIWVRYGSAFCLFATVLHLSENRLKQVAVQNRLHRVSTALNPQWSAFGGLSEAETHARCVNNSV